LVEVIGKRLCPIQAISLQYRARFSSTVDFSPKRPLVILCYYQSGLSASQYEIFPNGNFRVLIFAPTGQKKIAPGEAWGLK